MKASPRARTAGIVVLVAVGHLLASFLLLMVTWKAPDDAFTARLLPTGNLELTQPWWADATWTAIRVLSLPLGPLVRLVPFEIRPNGGWQMVMNALLWGGCVAWGVAWWRGRAGRDAGAPRETSQ